MKTLIKTLLLLISLSFLAACGGESNSSTQTTAPTKSVPTESATELVEGDPVAGKGQYDQICIGCHGIDGVGVPALGKPFTNSEFITSQTDAEMLAFIKQGRPSGDPANTTGIDMPPKGGNPAFNDNQILDIIAYLRTLQQ